jgi:hypothetical protein
MRAVYRDLFHDIAIQRTMPPLTRARTAAEAPTLLDALARAPVAAALVVAALGLADRKALRLVQPQLRDAVGEAATELEVNLSVAGAARTPTPARWPRLRMMFLEQTVASFDLETLEALGSETWGSLRELTFFQPLESPEQFALDAPCARALAAALRRMPALRELNLMSVQLPDASARELFRAPGANAAPQLDRLSVIDAKLSPVAARALAAAGWRLQELFLNLNPDLGAAGFAALCAAPTFALRHLNLCGCGLDAAALPSLADAPWPLEKLDLSGNDFSAATAGPALAALSQRAGLRRLDASNCSLSPASFKVLVEADWPALVFLSANLADVAFFGPHALGAAAFAGFPALEELDLSYVDLGSVGAALLASRRWPRLRSLDLRHTRLGDAGVAALARGAWPALEVLDLRLKRLGAPLTLEGARRWAPALVELAAGEPLADDSSDGDVSD